MRSKQQRAFARIVAECPDLDPTECARRAGYSAHTAKQQAHRLMHHPGVLTLIEEERARLEAVDRVHADIIGASKIDLSSRDVNPLDLTAVRALVVDNMAELAQQVENLNVAFKATEWLGRYCRVIEAAKARDEAAQQTVGEDGMDLETAKAVREAARRAA